MGQTNEDVAESVSSIDSGAIFLSSLKQKLSNDTLVVSFLLSERISLVRTGSGMMPKMTEISGKVASATSKSNFGGPAGGSALERASPAGGRGKIKKEVCFVMENIRLKRSKFN